MGILSPRTTKTHKTCVWYLPESIQNRTVNKLKVHNWVGRIKGNNVELAWMKYHLNTFRMDFVVKYLLRAFDEHHVISSDSFKYTAK